MSDRRLRRGLPRLVRAGFVALLTMTLGVGAHVYAGGQAPSAVVMIGLAAVFAVLCWALSAQRWTARPLLGVFVLAQVGTHALAMVQHPMDAMGGMSMAMSHLAAAVLLVVMVTRGESTLVRLVEHLALRCLNLRLVPTPPPADAAIARAVPSLLAHLFVSTVRGRAPPRSRVLPSP